MIHQFGKLIKRSIIGGLVINIPDTFVCSTCFFYKKHSFY